MDTYRNCKDSTEINIVNSENQIIFEALFFSINDLVIAKL